MDTRINSSAAQRMEGRVIRLHANDTVVVAAEDLAPDAFLPVENMIAKERVPPGHKVATRRMARGEPVRKYNQVIGFAGADIAAGSHVHTHNLEYRPVEPGGESGAAVGTTDFVPESERRNVSRHRACRRPDRHTELHRRADVGQLLGHGRADDRG